ncbi:MAG TPA: lytic transglycosylase domain-containing protein [Acetobacteraceae bacterium]|nr:lytic transglycosylase domain-containing protein [Acetobacteraceae bacterium]
MADCDMMAGPKLLPANGRVLLQTALGFAALALLSACASSGPQASPTAQADYYAAHAPGNYTPPGPASDPWGPYIRLASERFNVPQPWIRQVMRVESGGHEYMNGHLTISGAGAMGLMQLEPGTYQEMAARYGLGPDPFNPYNNIMAGAAYIHEMYQIYGSPGFLAAYNAGPGRLDNYLDYHEPLPDETRNYVAMIGPRIEGIYPSRRSEGDMLAMNQLPTHIAPGLRPDVQVASTESLNARSLAAHPAVQNTSAIPLPTPAPLPAAPQPAAPAPAPVEVAALAPPPSFERPAYAPPARIAAPPRRRFALIPTAEAAAPPPRLETASLNTGSGWAVQVGAYNTPAKARAALGIAELSAVSSLIHGQPVVDSVSTPRGMFYRARFVHLPHEAAISTCNRLSGSSTGCMVISPDAQS